MGGFNRRSRSTLGPEIKDEVESKMARLRGSDAEQARKIFPIVSTSVARRIILLIIEHYKGDEKDHADCIYGFHMQILLFKRIALNFLTISNYLIR